MRFSLIRTLGSMISTLLVITATVVAMNAAATGTGNAHPLSEVYCDPPVA